MEIGSSKAPALARRCPSSVPNGFSFRERDPECNSSVRAVSKTVAKIQASVIRGAECGERTSGRSWRLCAESQPGTSMQTALPLHL